MSELRRRYLLDTNVISELRRPRAADAVRGWIRAQSVATLAISVITFMELEIGVRRVERSDPYQGEVLRQWLEQRVVAAFRERILPIDLEVARRASALPVLDPGPERDTLIAATALVHGLTVVTRDVADFAPTGVTLLDPWGGDPLKAKQDPRNFAGQSGQVWPVRFTVSVALWGLWGGNGFMAISPGRLECGPEPWLRRLSGIPTVVHEELDVDIFLVRLAPPWFNVFIPVRGQGFVLVAGRWRLGLRKVDGTLESAGFSVAEHHTWSPTFRSR